MDEIWHKRKITITNRTMLDKAIKHTKLEDVVAVLTGTSFFALGVFFLQSAGLSTGAITGLSLLVEHLTGAPFGVLFLVFNIPFYFLAWARFGKVFTLASIVAASSVSFINKLFGLGVHIELVSPFLGAAIAGFLLGVGMLMLFRHRASPGCLFTGKKDCFSG